MAWLAQLQADDLNASAREADRRQLRLHVAAVAGPNSARVLVHNISTTGLLVECDPETILPESFEVELPEQGMTPARIVWRSDSFYGCEFDTPVANRIISASQLRSAPEVGPSAEVPASLYGSPSEGPEHSASVEPQVEGFSPRTKLAIIVGSAGSLWAIILLGISLLA